MVGFGLVSEFGVWHVGCVVDRCDDLSLVVVWGRFGFLVLCGLLC